MLRLATVGIILLTLLNVPLSAQATSRPAPRVRILSYNIRHGQGLDNRIDLPRIARVILKQRPDIVALQEVDRGVARTQRVDQPKVLAKLCGMHAVFKRNIGYQGGDYGNAILSKRAPLSHKNHLLPELYADEQRGALEAVIPLGAGAQAPRLRFFSTHFSWHPEGRERRASAKVLQTMIDRDPKALMVLAGDLNCGLDSPTVALLRKRWTFPSGTEIATFPSLMPLRQIDHIISRPAKRWKVIETKVVDGERASDHRPLLIVLELRP